MVLKTKYFDLETTEFELKDPDAMRQRLEIRCWDYFTNEPTDKYLAYGGPKTKLRLHYKERAFTQDEIYRTATSFPLEDLAFPEVGCIEGYKIIHSDWTYDDFTYELNHTYSIDEDPVPLLRGFHFCTELANCFKYCRPEDIFLNVTDLRTLRFLKVRSNGITYQYNDEYCTNNITILDECTTEEILDAFIKWNSPYVFYDMFFLREDFYKYYKGVWYKERKIQQCSVAIDNKN